MADEPDSLDSESFIDMIYDPDEDDIDDDDGVSGVDDDDADSALASDFRTTGVNSGGGSAEFQLLDPESLLRHMSEITSAVQQVTKINSTYLRLLLSHFKWDKDALLEFYFENDRSKTFAEAGLTTPSEKSWLTSEHVLNCVKSTSTMCDICCETKSTFLCLPCRHLFCSSCWCNYIQAIVNSSTNVDLITCPASTCSLIVDDSVVFDLVSSSPITSRRYKKLISNSFVSHNRCLTWCPGVDCGYAANCLSGLREPRQVDCTHCNESLCFACGWSWHDPAKCDRLLAWSNEISTDSGTYNWIMANTKDCPKCHATIEKNGGCNHMICRNPACKYEFCWLCLDKWEPHGSRWYQCNRFDDETAKTARAAQVQSRSFLERYLFCFNRYYNHRQSLSFETHLAASVSEKMAAVQSNNAGTSWIDVKFLTKVVQVLCSCRRTLMYTYVFAYYAKRSNQSAIFEVNQYDLEQATEQLSELLERDWNSLGLVALKQSMQDKARYCSTRRQVLLDHVHEGYEKDWWDGTSSSSC